MQKVTHVFVIKALGHFRLNFCSVLPRFYVCHNFDIWIVFSHCALPGAFSTLPSPMSSGRFHQNPAECWNSQWNSREIPWKFLWIPADSEWNSYGFWVEFQWNLNGIPMPKILNSMHLTIEKIACFQIWHPSHIYYNISFSSDRGDL
jgi:hypothetical protein